MKKQNIILLIIVLVLAGLVVYFLKFYGKTSSDDCGNGEEFKQFAVKDTASVTKIFIAEKSGKSVTLERSKDGWLVNGKYPARKDAIFNILKTICRIEIKMPVSKSSHNTIVRNMAGRSTKVEIYDKNGLIKTWYVGGATKDQFGTFMLMEIDGLMACEPQITHIPGFTGFLSSRFFCDVEEWKEKSIFKYKFEEIKSLKIEDGENPDRSYIASNLGNNRFELSSVSGKNFPAFDTIMVKKLLAGYKKVFYESIVVSLSPQQVDSVIKSKPLKVITLTDNKGKKNIIKMFRRPGDGLLDEEGKEMQWDPDRAFGYTDKHGLIILQYFVFDPLTPDIEMFLE
ncbi:MAG: hypothetical protein A2W91_01310 [Bacteroidetes bacterium GWF2_38_335]|nr:MAG: hypothetical protein A2W91_01310 [Bacteroidetes bacterium GWF2_38_335]OFY80962.1 MAG: hypothetical protein A2281_12955 [Bacteroidetes bacterium RIFOXYA12_FULL_38_20]HBS85101.1 hypothetical protein [Bacteroidales bacterium]